MPGVSLFSLRQVIRNREAAESPPRQTYQRDEVLGLRKMLQLASTYSQAQAFMSTAYTWNRKHSVSSQEPSGAHRCIDNRRKLYACHICLKKFSQKVYLTKHLPIHTSQYKCPTCDKTLQSNESLQNHVRICSRVHIIETVGKVTCDVCAKVSALFLSVLKKGPNKCSSVIPVKLVPGLSGKFNYAQL